MAPWLRQLDLEWAGSVIDTAWMLPLPALASLELDALSIKLDARIAEQSQLTRLKVRAALAWAQLRAPAHLCCCTPPASRSALLHPAPPPQARACMPPPACIAQGEATHCTRRLPQLAGQLSLPNAEGALPPGLKVLSISHSDPLQLPACLPRLTALQRLNLSECTFGGGEGEAEAADWAAPLVAATSLEVGWGRGVGFCGPVQHGAVFQVHPGADLGGMEAERRRTQCDCWGVPDCSPAWSQLPLPHCPPTLYLEAAVTHAPVPACLQHLAMHYCTMARLPPALSGLTNLRALLLDYNDHQQLDEDLEEVGLSGLALHEGERAGGRRTRALVFEGQGLPRTAASWIQYLSPLSSLPGLPSDDNAVGPLLHRCWRHSSSCRSWGSATAD